jgi:hypothetical protein
VTFGCICLIRVKSGVPNLYAERAYRVYQTQSHATPNRVSATRKRILKIGDKRLAREIERWWPNIQKIELQRPRNVSLTLGNVALILMNGKHPLETGLVGWGAWIRTREWRNQKSSCHFEFMSLFSRLRRKVLVPDQYVSGNFPTVSL